MSLEYVIGLIVLIVIAVICIAGAVMLWREWKKSRESKKAAGVTEFDERQELVRGKGFQYGFLVLLGYEFIMSLLCLEKTPAWFNFSAIQVIGMGAAMMVFCTYCIWNEAYIGLHESPAATYLFLGGIGGFNLLEAIVDGMNGKLVVDGVLTNRVASLVLGILFLAVLTVSLVRNFVNRRKEE